MCNFSFISKCEYGLWGRGNSNYLKMDRSKLEKSLVVPPPLAATKVLHMHCLLLMIQTIIPRRPCRVSWYKRTYVIISKIKHPSSWYIEKSVRFHFLFLFALWFINMGSLLWYLSWASLHVAKKCSGLFPFSLSSLLQQQYSFP